MLIDNFIYKNGSLNILLYDHFIEMCLCFSPPVPPCLHSRSSLFWDHCFYVVRYISIGVDYTFLRILNYLNVNGKMFWGFMGWDHIWHLTPCLPFSISICSKYHSLYSFWLIWCQYLNCIYPVRSEISVM